MGVKSLDTKGDKRHTRGQFDQTIFVQIFAQTTCALDSCIVYQKSERGIRRSTLVYVGNETNGEVVGKKTDIRDWTYEASIVQIMSTTSLCHMALTLWHNTSCYASLGHGMSVCVVLLLHNYEVVHGFV